MPPRAAFSAFAVFLGLAVIFPFLNYYRVPPLGDFDGEFAGAVLFAIAAAFSLSFLPARLRVDASLFVPPLVLAALVVVHAALNPLLHEVDWFSWLIYLGLLSLAMLVAQGARAAGLEGEVGGRLAWALVIVAVVSFLCQIVQLARAEDLFQPFVLRLWDRSICRPYGNMGQANHATTVIWLAIGATIYLAGVGRMRWVTAAALLGIFLLSSALTSSRMAWIFVAVVVFVCLTFRAWPLPSRRSRVILSIALVLGFLLAGVLSKPVLGSMAGACQDTVERLVGDNYSIRWGLWREALLVWRDSPWIGSGPNRFMGAAYQLAPSGQHLPLDAFAHNSALQVLAEFGVVGAVTVAAACVLWMVALFRRRRELKPVDTLLIVWLGILGGHSGLEFPLWYVQFLLLFGLSLGLLIVPGRSGPTLPVLSRGVVAGMAALALMTAVFVFRDYRSLDRAVFLYQTQRALAPLGAGQNLDAAIDEAAARVRLFGLYRDYFLARRIPLNREHLDEKLEANEKLLRRGPLPDVIGRQILLLTLAGNFDEARWHVQRLATFYPATLKEESAVEMRGFIEKYPADFGALGQILDDELRRIPTRGW